VGTSHIENGTAHDGPTRCAAKVGEEPLKKVMDAQKSCRQVFK
jgi:hypothetical protein